MNDPTPCPAWPHELARIGSPTPHYGETRPGDAFGSLPVERVIYEPDGSVTMKTTTYDVHVPANAGPHVRADRKVAA